MTKIKLTNKKKFILLAILLVAVISAGTFIFAKYYATTNNKGVAVASGFYFNSNILANIEGNTDIMQVKDNANDIPIYWNPKTWEGVNYTFSVEIRNFDSILLYNDANLNVEYNVAFILIGEEPGASYTVKCTANASEDIIDSEIHTLSATSPITYTGRLSGGQARYDKYEVNIHIENTDTFNGKSAKILAVAYPTEPEYIARTAKALRLISIMQADYTQPEISIDHQGFVMAQHAYDGLEWNEAVSNYSGFEYSITTTGDIASNGSETRTQEMELTWDNTLLTINKYDSYYVEAKNKGLVVDNGDGTTTMTMKAMPYANMIFTFYRKVEGEDFKSLTKEQFESLVHGEIIKR